MCLIAVILADVGWLQLKAVIVDSSLKVVEKYESSVGFDKLGEFG